MSCLCFCDPVDDGNNNNNNNFFISMDKFQVK